ncbi:acyl-CoA dehydrogenase family protein [Elusimicrobiota bacterium]
MNIDFLKTDELGFSDDEKTLRDLTRGFVSREILPSICKWDAGDVSPHKDSEALIRHIAKKLASTTGVFGAHFHGIEKYLSGCEFTPITPTAYGVALREFEYGDSSLRSLASVQSSLCMFAINEYGSEEQKKKWLPLLFKGEKIACFGLTEPQGGSDPANMKTKARKTKSGWVLDGAKAWITNGFADVAVAWANTEEGIRGFLVEKGAQGFTFRHENKWALRAGIASSLFFNDCEIKQEDLLPGTVQKSGGADLKCALRCLNEARYGICWGVVGAARACFEEAVRFSKERQLFGKSLACKQETQRKLAYMLGEIELAGLLALHLGKLKSTNELSHVHVSLGKYNNVSRALEVAQMACELLSADVFSFDAYNSGRHMRNLHIVKKYEGTHEIHALVLGRAITGVSAF